MNTNWIILLIGLAGGAFPAWRVTSEHYQKMLAEEHEAQQQLVIEAQKEFKNKTDRYDKEKIYIAEVYEEYRRTHPVIKTKEVTKYVSVESDARCVIPVGFVRLHNAAASGESLPETDNGIESNDSPTKLTLSATGGIVAENYNRCLLEFEKLKALQATIREFQAINK